jgi:hypothetical protein
VFLGQRTVNTAEWTLADTELALALEDYEASLCPGGEHVLDESSLADREDAYRPGFPIRCHYCTAQALVSETASKNHERPDGLLFPIVLDAELVELNRKPVPPLPPELM